MYNWKRKRFLSGLRFDTMGLTKAINFLKGITPKDEIVIIYNNDGDGISACTIVKKFLERTGRKKPYIIAQPMPMDKNLVQRVKMTLPHKIIFLDMAADQQLSILKQLSGFCEILIIDHHQVHKNMNSSKIAHYNPRLDDREVYQSTSYCIYKICSKITDMEDALWVAGVGMVSDYALGDSKDLVKQIKEKYNVGDKLYDTKLGRIADMISSTSATKALSCDQMVEVLNNATLEEFDRTTNAEKMIESYDIIKQEMSHLEEDVEHNSEKIGKVIFYNINSKYKLTSPLSTRASEKHQKSLIVIFEKIGNHIKVSSRNQAKNINAGKVMQKAAGEVGGSGGGHEAAAGATIPVGEWDRFKELVVKIANRT